jgi:hypothetical protein
LSIVPYLAEVSVDFDRVANGLGRNTETAACRCETEEVVKWTHLPESE